MSPSAAAVEPAPVAPELLRQVRSLQIRARRLVTELLAGEYASAFRGRGIEFEEARPYQPGDDVRTIDWKVTARTGLPHVKRHREERELTVLLLADVSSSGSFGSGTRLKRETLEEVAAVLATSAIRSHDRVGLILFSDRIERYIPPKRGRAHGWRIVREIVASRPGRRGTDLAAPLEFLARVTRHRAVAFLLSDFLQPEEREAAYAERLRLVARRHDLTAIAVTDRREQELPRIGWVALEDPESGETALVDTGDRRFARAFAERATARRAARSALLRSAGVGELEIAAGEPWIDRLVHFFQARERRR
jgi:uncharacterized protein (DUF58 family)